MKKIIAILLSLAVLTLSGCSGKENTQTVTQPAAADELWEYEYYIEDLIYYTDKYNEAIARFSELCSLSDFDAAAEEAKSHNEILDEFAAIVTPSGLEEQQNNIIAAVENEKKYRELAVSLLYYMENYDTLTPAELEEYNQLCQQIESMKSELELSDAVRSARETAFSCLPNGEYRSYDYNLTSLWNMYISRFNALYEVFFNGAAGDPLLCCDKCLEILPKIENIEAPESLKPYHDDVISALSTEREFCMAVKAIAELSREYQGFEQDELPADVQEEVKKHSKTIDDYFGQENGAHTDSNKAVHAALEFAETQTGQ